MLHAALVSQNEELEQIHLLNQANLKANVDRQTQQQEGFVSWLYALPLLQQLHELAPSVIAMRGKAVAGYALVTLREAATFHPDLKQMIDKVQHLSFENKALSSLRWYVMGQICIDKAFRGMGVFDMLYGKHRDVYSNSFDLVITEVSAANMRSQKAHERMGFKTIHAYRDKMDDWNVLAWNWH